MRDPRVQIGPGHYIGQYQSLDGKRPSMLPYALVIGSGAISGGALGAYFSPKKVMDGLLIGGFAGAFTGLVASSIMISIFRKREEEPEPVVPPPDSVVKTPVPSPIPAPMDMQERKPLINPLIGTILGFGVGCTIVILTTKKEDSLTKPIWGGLVGGTVGLAGTLAINATSPRRVVPVSAPVDRTIPISVASMSLGIASGCLMAPWGSKTAAGIVGGIGSGATALIGSFFGKNSGGVAGGVLGVIGTGVISMLIPEDRVYKRLSEAVNAFNKAKALAYEAVADFSEARRISGDLMGVDKKILNPNMSTKAASVLSKAFSAAGTSILDFDRAVCQHVKDDKEPKKIAKGEELKSKVTHTIKEALTKV